ncbi:MAG: efflux RND transporter permease subunit [Candidatus Binataceae bacterium]
MAVVNGKRSWGLGERILRHRAPIGAFLIAITVFMAYWAVHVPIATRFDDFFPANHPNTQLYREFRRQYGGAQTLVVLIRQQKGDIFNFKMLHTIQDITTAVNALPGVNHNEVFSLSSYRVVYARALPGALVATPFMYPKVPETQAQLDDLKNAVLAHREQLAGDITYDLKGALVIASFNEEGLDYGALFNSVQDIIHKHEDANTRIYVSGAVMFSAWGYHYLPRIGIIFALAVALMLILLYLSLGRRSGWWAPIVTGICSAIWGLGFMSLMGFNFDPAMLVIPFILTARDLSHGIQWHGRYYNELDRTDDKMAACATTTNVMLPPGLLAILANVAGIIFIAVGDIPALKQIGFGGAVWLGASLPMVFVLQPILMSYLKRPQVYERSWLNRLSGTGRHAFGEWLARVPVTPGALRTALIAGGAVFLVIGIVSSRGVQIGFQTQGTPIYRPEAKVNRDTAEIAKFIPTDYGWVVLHTPNYPDPQSGVGVAPLRMSDDLADYLMSRGDAIAVLGFGTLATKPMDMLLHNGFPKYMAMPYSDALSANLWGFFFSGTAPDEVYSFFAHSPSMTSSCIRILLPDHTYARLSRLRDDLNTFVRERVAPDPTINHVKVRFLGGDAGLYLAVDDVIPRLNFINLALTLAAILICCGIIFRSPVAAVLFLLACVMANVAAFIYMFGSDIGLTVDTIPVISLGIGLGIDYGIYTVARIRDEVSEGLTLNNAIATALRTTGLWVFATFVVMVGGILPWVFSPLLFHNEMSVLLILLMIANLIVGVLILPAFIAWRRPNFIARYETPGAATPEAMADVHVS